MFCLATCLRVVWSSDVMTGPMFWQVLAKVLVNEVSASITYHHSRNSKTWKYYFFKHLLGVLCINSSTWHGFNPLGDISNCLQDVLIAFWLWKHAHVVDSPDIKELYLEVVGEWHGISWIDIPVPLTRSTPPDEVFHVFIYGWPKESTLLDLCMSAECVIMSSIWWWVTSFNDLHALFCRYTSSEQAIRADSKEVWRIPYLEMTFIDELPFVLPWWYITYNHKIDNICVPGVGFCGIKEHIIP